MYRIAMEKLNKWKESVCGHCIYFSAGIDSMA